MWFLYKYIQDYYVQNKPIVNYQQHQETNVYSQGRVEINQNGVFCSFSLRALLLKKSNFVFYYIPWMPVHFQYLLQPFIQLHIQRCTEKFSLRTQFWIPNFNVNRIFCFLFSLSTLNSVLWEQSKFSSLKTKYMTQFP